MKTSDKEIGDTIILLWISYVLEEGTLRIVFEGVVTCWWSVYLI